ncbi:MAG: hypothetical protein HXY34_12570, partial [Candidatus Thorarchaeota archaeon]|nr:hypothetical protein [Candidatus Thorarchaeota archaeon]
MRAKLMIEVIGKAREELKLQSLVPALPDLFDDWRMCWVSAKDLKRWEKAEWPVRTLGEQKRGKILRGV